MNMWCRAECCKCIQIGIQNAVENLLSIFDIFISQFSFTTAISELKELNYSYHDIYLWLSSHPLLIVAFYCKHSHFPEAWEPLLMKTRAKKALSTSALLVPAVTNIPVLCYEGSTFALFTLSLSASQQEILVALDVNWKHWNHCRWAFALQTWAHHVLEGFLNCF